MADGTSRDDDRPRRADSGNDGEPTWYTDRRGRLILAFYCLLTLVVVTVSARELSFAGWLVDAYRSVAGWIRTVALLLGSGPPVPAAPPGWLSTRSALPGLVTTVPLDVYLFGLAGALTRFLLSFVMDVAALTDPGGLTSRADAGDGNGAAPGEPRGDGSEYELLRLLLGIPAAVYLATGVYLVGAQITGLLQRFETGAVFVVVSYVAGFYVRRSYLLLGDVADRLLPVDDSGEGRTGSMFARTFDLPIAGASGTDDTLDARRAATDEASPRPGYSGWPGRLLFGVVVLLAIGVLLVLLDDGPADGICATAPCPRIPADVYVYAFMGGIGYVFTKLFVDVNRSRRSVLESTVRILAGVFIAVGIYVLFDPVDGAIAAVAFLVGLYLNVAVVRFDAIADQLFARLRRTVRRTDDGDERSEDS